MAVGEMLVRASMGPQFNPCGRWGGMTAPVKSKVHQMSPVRLEPKKIYESAFQVTYCYETNAT